MYTVIATLKVREGKMDDAVQVLKEDVPKLMKNEPGCLAYIPHLVKGEGNGTTLVIYEKYADKDALKLHSANLGASMGRLLALLDPQMDIKTCTEIL
ncbi:MAG: antibiotic biosynthesis monooxygenase [Deltaproteobacteria bacterium]|nr:antibiotic biosynthesis monooxygenase [Deltaproteobacteria bacterium]